MPVDVEVEVLDRQALQYVQQKEYVVTPQCLQAATSLSLLSTVTFKRAHVSTENRVDNNIDKVLRTLGYTRSKEHSRKMSFKAALVADFLKQITAFVFECPTHVHSYHTVLAKMQLLVHEYGNNLRRTAYSNEFKAALKTLASEDGAAFLTRALANSK